MKVDKQIIIDACITSKTMAEAACKVPQINSNTFRKYAKLLECYKPNKGAKGTSKLYSGEKFLLSDILNGLHPQYGSHKIRIRLIKENVKADVCELCGVGNIWNGKPLSLRLDHIDGNPRNHLLSNLQILCPNCHTQTITHGSKNRNKGD